LGKPDRLDKKARLIYTPRVSAAAILDGTPLAGATATVARILTASSIAGADVVGFDFSGISFPGRDFPGCSSTA
jgi:hypothetical protein